MQYYCVYKKATGEITEFRQSNTERGYSGVSLPGHLEYIVFSSNEHFDISTHKVNLTNKQVEVKANIPIISNKASIQGNGTDTCIFSQIPAGTLASSPDLKIYETINDGSVELSVDAPGAYLLTFSHPLYLDAEFEVTAT